MALRRKQKREIPRAGPFPPGWDVPAAFNFTRDVVELWARDPLRSALTFVDREGIVDRRTFADVARDAAKWAHLLRTRVDRGDRVLIVVGKVPAWHGVMLGAIKGGLVAVPCPDMLRARDLAFRARHSGARLVVAARECEPEIEEMRNQIGDIVPVLYLDEARHELDTYMPKAPTEETTAGETALILYTSGTTKEPKGVVHTHAYTWAQRMQAAQWLDAQERDVVWCTAGTGWAKAIWNVLLGPWSQGAEVVLHENAFDAEERMSLVQRLGVSVLCQAPTEYRMLAKLDNLATAYLPKLRHAVSAGEPLNPEVIGRFQDALGLTVHDGYGQTENSLLVANLPGAPVRPGSMGLPTEGHDVAVIDAAGAVCEPGVEGDIALLGRPPTLFTGYWNDREQTDAVFRGDWYLTGDRAVRDEEGYVWFVGRTDDVILSSAYRIGPFEVESALLEHPAVAESAVVGVPDADRGQIVKAFVVVRPGHEADERLAVELQDHVKAITAPYKYPRAISFVDELPKTTSGKIRRSELREVGDGVEQFVPAPAVALRAVPDLVDEDAEAAAEAARLEAEATERAAAAERARAEAEAAARRAAEEAERARVEAEEVARRVAEEQARAGAETEVAERARADAEAEQARLQAEEAARLQAEEAARLQAEEAARLQAEEAARLQAEEAARVGAEEAARREAEAAEQARVEAEEAARREADERARAEAEAAEQARQEAETAAAVQARLEAEEAARREAEERTRAEAEAAEQARLVAEAAEQARLEAEEAARREAEERARAEAEAAEQARQDAEAAAAEQARLEAEEAARREAEERTRAEAEAAEQARLEAEAAAAEQAAAEEERLRAEAWEAERLRAEAQAEAEALALAEPEVGTTEDAVDEESEGVSWREGRRLKKEEAARQKAAEEDARRRAKAEAEQRKRDEKAEQEAAKRRAEEEKIAAKQRAIDEQEAAKRQAEDEKRREAEEKIAAKQFAEDEKRRQKEREEQRKRDEAAAREEAARREAEEKAAAKRAEEAERRKKAYGRPRRGLGKLLPGDEVEDDYGSPDDEETPVAPIPDLVERLQRYSGGIAGVGPDAAPSKDGDEPDHGDAAVDPGPWDERRSAP